MNRRTKSGLLATTAGLALLLAPTAVGAVETQDDMQTSTSAVSVKKETKRAALTFKSGRIDGGYAEFAVINDQGAIAGLTTDGTDFFQNDGWDQDSQTWQAGNELEFGSDDDEFSIADLKYEGGTVTGHVTGSQCVLRDGLLDLSDEQAEARVEIVGDDVTIIFIDTYGGSWVLNFERIYY